MDFVSLILTAFGLSADAFAVSMTNGMCAEKITKKQAFLTAFTFGLFQAGMPALGFALGKTFSAQVDQYQHWIALILLSIIGINMIKEAYKECKISEEVCSTQNVFSAKNLILQGIATSIDALAAGVAFAAMKNHLLLSIAVIGIITFVCCSFGVFIGKKFGCLFGSKAKFVGGCILIIIGLRLFIMHYFC